MTVGVGLLQASLRLGSLCLAKKGVGTEECGPREAGEAGGSRSELPLLTSVPAAALLLLPSRKTKD